MTRAGAVSAPGPASCNVGAASFGAGASMTCRGSLGRSIRGAAAATAFAEARLAPLDAYRDASGIDLAHTLRVWLDHHGQFDPAAAELGLHRHTLRYRVRKAEQLLGRQLGDVNVRMDVWFALAARDRATG